MASDLISYRLISEALGLSVKLRSYQSCNLPNLYLESTNSRDVAASIATFKSMRHERAVGTPY